MVTRNKQITPSRAIHPGEILREELLERGIKQKEFASRIGVIASNLNEFINGKRGLSEEWAMKFEEALGISYKTWMALYNAYIYDIKVLEERSAEERMAIAFEAQCANVFNIKDFYKRLNIQMQTCIERVRWIKSLFSFDLRNASEMQYQIAGMYKHGVKTQIDDKNMLTWLLLNHVAVSESEKPTNSFVKGNATMVAKQIAVMANSGEITTAKIKQHLSTAGIGYVEVEKLPKAPIDAFCTTHNGYPVISVTYRYDDMDKLVFDVLHELYHIDNHLSEECKSFISVDGADYSQDYREKEANDFARNLLISDDLWKSIMRKGSKDLSLHSIIKVIATEARKNNISPTIAVARYKYDTGWYSTKAYKSPKIH